VYALASHLQVEVFREGKHYMQEYSQGAPLYAVKQVGETEKRGTYVKFTPDASIFSTLEYSYSTLSDRLRELSFLNKGLTLSIKDLRSMDEEGNCDQEIFHSEAGLKDFISYIDETREKLMPEAICMEGEKNNIPVEVAMQYNTSFTENIHSYVNNINTHEGGTHLAGFRRGLTRTLKGYAEKSGLLDKIKFEISGDDFREGLTAVISVKVQEPQFE
ncbi:MAG: DNA topoisomerase IV subunit B, partial [Bacteroidales bacterium]